MRAPPTGRDWRDGTEVAVQGGGNIVRGSKDTLGDRLAATAVKISVIGRESRKTSSIPVWFVLEGETINLLPVLGSETQ